MNAVPYDVLTEDQIAAGLEDYDLLIVPSFRNDARDDVISRLGESGMAAIANFVHAGGTLYAQGSGLHIAQTAGLLPAGTVSEYESLTLESADQANNRGQLEILQSDSPLAWSWLTHSLYILNDPVLHFDESATVDIVAQITNATGGPYPAVFRAPYGIGQVIGVVGHPTDTARRNELPLFMDALLLALSGNADFYGDAVQTWNPAYDPHEFPAYESVPVSATLVIENLWDTPLLNATVTETLAVGYALTGTVTPTATQVYTTGAGQTIIVWDLGRLTPNATLTLTYQAQSEPDTLAAGIGTFATGELAYTDPSGRPITAHHRPFILTAQMAARLVGDRDVEPDRRYIILDKGLYLDVALPLENKEWTLAHNVVVTDWVYLIYPIVDLEDQHVILSSNDGETIWMRNEPFLWGSKGDPAGSPYPLPVGETVPTRTYTLADWQGDWCVFTSTYGIHTDPPSHTLRVQTEDYGSFITIPPTYTNYISVTADHRLLLPCLPLTFDLGDWPGYWYEEPAVRYGVHSRELLGREVRFHGTPRENVVVMPYDAGSIYVAAGTDPVPFRQYLTAAVPYAAAAPTTPGITYQDVWSRTHVTPFRATFYDTWDWDSCATCRRDLDQHAAINLTFGMYADLDGDGVPETFVREIPTALSQTRLVLMGKTINRDPNDTGVTIPPDQNLIDLPIFHGLGVRIGPENETWADSWRSPLGRTTLVSVAETTAYDHLYFQQDIPLGSWETFYVTATIATYDFNREGMFKLHDGARLIYRQMAAGPNRYEIYDAHVHSAMGLSSDGQVTGWVGPTAISVYSDSVYYLYTVNDQYDPRAFTQDPYMQSWGYGDFVATSYVGGREQKTLFRSIVAAHDRTRARVALDNNTGVTLTNVAVTIDAPDWITVTRLYTDPATAPEPIWPELAFLNVDTIPDAWRGVYYFDLSIGDIPTDLLGSVITLPVQASASGLPAGYEAPPLVLALRGTGGMVPEITLGPADDLLFTAAPPLTYTVVQSVTLIDAAQALSLALYTDNDAQHPLSDTAATLFASFAPTLPFAVNESILTVTLPATYRTLPGDAPLRLAVRASITRAHHGPNTVGDGGNICYTDPFDVRRCAQGAPLVVEAGGAVVNIEYECEGGSAGVYTGEDGNCVVPPDRESEIIIRIIAYNEGDALARGLVATPELPADVTLVSGPATLSLGDLAPAGWQSVRVTLRVAPNSNEIGEAAHGWQMPVVARTTGQFFDTAAQRLITGQLGDQFTVGVLWKPRAVYLPVLVRSWDARPDLIVATIVPSPDAPHGLQVTIANTGHSAARNFWVDTYLDPSTPPQVNQPWPDLSLYGVAWFVDNLAAGERITLTIGDTHYQAEHSRWPTAYPSGEHAIWAYADSWGHPQPYGAVSETNEDNNQGGPVSFVIAGGTTNGTEPEWPAIPPRPLQPGRSR